MAKPRRFYFRADNGYGGIEINRVYEESGDYIEYEDYHDLAGSISKAKAKIVKILHEEVTTEVDAETLEWLVEDLDTMGTE